MAWLAYHFELENIFVWLNLRVIEFWTLNWTLILYWPESKNDLTKEERSKKNPNTLIYTDWYEYTDWYKYTDWYERNTLIYTDWYEYPDWYEYTNWYEYTLIYTDWYEYLDWYEYTLTYTEELTRVVEKTESLTRLCP